MIVTEKQINQQKTRIGVLNLVSDACRYYNYTVDDEFSLNNEIETLKRINSNDVEIELLLSIFESAENRLNEVKK